MIPRSPFVDKARTWFWPSWLLLQNLIVIGGSELAHDEAYYWTFSRALDWGYFDHPPLTAWLIALTSGWIPGEWGVRLPFALFLQFSVWLVASLVPDARRWQVWAGFAFFPLLSFMGGFALPDGALVIVSALWLWALARSLKEDNVPHALVMGLMSALLLYGKYHGVLYLVGTILALPRLLARRIFWLATVFALVLYLPHVHWQWDHQFATFKYHFLERPSATAGWKAQAEFLLAQIFLSGFLVGPLLWWRFFKTKSTSDFDRVLKCLAIFVPMFFFISTFSKKFEANWTVAAAIPFLIFLVRSGEFWRPSRLSFGLFSSSTIIVFFAHLLMVLPNGGQFVRRLNEFHGWRDWSQKVEARATGGCSLAANTYQMASKLSFYLQKDIPSLNVGGRQNQYAYHDLSFLESAPICWVTDQKKIFSGEKLETPDHKSLLLVKGVSLNDILAHRE